MEHELGQLQANQPKGVTEMELERCPPLPPKKRCVCVCTSILSCESPGLILQGEQARKADRLEQLCSKKAPICKAQSVRIETVHGV